MSNQGEKQVTALEQEPQFRRPDVAAPRREIVNQSGINDICPGPPRSPAATLTAHLEHIDRINQGLDALIELTQKTIVRNNAERESTARELALITKAAA